MITARELQEILAREMVRAARARAFGPQHAELPAEMPAAVEPLALAVARRFTRDVAVMLIDSGVTYYLIQPGAGIVCLRCGLVSRHPEDIRQLYCGQCKAFHEPQ